MSYLMNLSFIVVLAVLSVIIIYFSFRKKDSVIEYPAEQFKLGTIISLVKNEINKILNTDVQELHLNETETKKRIKQKSILRDSVRNCCLGDSGKREFVKEYIKSILQEGLGVSENNIDNVISFQQPEEGSIKFLILYYILAGKYGNKTYGYLCDFEWELEKAKEDGIHYEISEEDINHSFEKNYRLLSFSEKLEILTQLIYQELYGLDVVDIIISDDSIDNVSGGVGGITELDYNYLEELMESNQTKNNCYDSIFVMYHGKQIRQAFLSFGTKARLMRVVKNIYRYDAPEMLTSQNGFVVANRQDNTRVTVARPSVSASWAFFLRKFKSIRYDLDILLTGGGKEVAIQTLKWIIKASETFTISGSPAAGKTTMLKALVPYIDPRLSIRMAESVFETMFNVLLPDRNIQVMQERGKVKIPDIINAFKKMDTDITILGEITEPEMAGAFVQIVQSGGKMTMCTLHHETTEKLIEYMRNALMVYYELKDSMIAEQQVISILNFDIHMAKSTSGYRYIERITEIIPIEKPLYQGKETTAECMKSFFEFVAESSCWKPYRVQNILEYDTESNQYVIRNGLSEIGLKRFRKKLSGDDYRECMNFFESVRESRG